MQIPEQAGAQTPSAQDGIPVHTTETARAAREAWEKDGGKALQTIDRLKTKAKDAPLSAEEQHELDQAEKLQANVRVANLETEHQNRPQGLDPVKAQALETERAILQKSASGGGGAGEPAAVPAGQGASPPQPMNGGAGNGGKGGGESPPPPPPPGPEQPIPPSSAESIEDNRGLRVDQPSAHERTPLADPERSAPSPHDNPHISGGRPELPEGAKLLNSSEHWFVFEENGKKWVRFYAPEARSPNGAKEGGRGDGHGDTAAYLNPEGRIYVEEGQHRLNGVVLEGKTNLSSVPGHPKWLEYQFHGTTEAKGEPPAYNPGKPHENENRMNPWDGMEGY